MLLSKFSYVLQYQFTLLLSVSYGAVTYTEWFSEWENNKKRVSGDGNGFTVLLYHWLKGEEYSEKELGHPSTDWLTCICIFLFPLIMGEQHADLTAHIFTVHNHYFLWEVEGITDCPGHKSLIEPVSLFIKVHASGLKAHMKKLVSQFVQIFTAVAS